MQLHNSWFAIHHVFATTCLAMVENAFILDLALLRLRETALGAKHKELNVAMHQILESLIGAGSADDRTVSLFAASSLSSKLTTKTLHVFTRSPVKARTDICNVGSHSLDAISRTFNVSKDGAHLATTFRIINEVGTQDVDHLLSLDWRV